MEINLSHDSIGAIVVHATSTLERSHGNYQIFRNTLSHITAEHIRDMRERIKKDPNTGLNNEPIDVAVYFFALFEETTVGIMDAIKSLQSGSGNESEIVLLFLFLTQNTNCLTCLAMIARGGLLSDLQAKEHVAKTSRIQATIKANERWKNDPKHREKNFIKECWQAWQDNPKQYKSKAAFARDMLDKHEHLLSTKVIEDWARGWEINLKKS